VDGLDDAETWRWIWLLATVVLAGSELAVPGTFFMISFAAGALVATVLAFAGLGVAGQWLAFVVGSGIALALLVPVGRRLSRGSAPSAVGANRWAGRRAVVLETIPAGAHETGLVRVEREQWRAESADGAEVAVGTTVRVLRVDGTRLVVARPDDPTPTPGD
jgi:membrane protein implicated in regulation of membrane protease activity